MNGSKHNQLTIDKFRDFLYEHSLPISAGCFFVWIHIGILIITPLNPPMNLYYPLVAVFYYFPFLRYFDHSFDIIVLGSMYMFIIGVLLEKLFERIMEPICIGYFSEK